MRRLAPVADTQRPLLVEAAMSQPSAEVQAFALPAGTVTFLLTDIEGSTRLWEAAAATMPGAVARHYEILDEAIADHDGVRPVEQGEGDSVVAAFARAADAVAAALSAQRALCAERWPRDTPLRVRVALHTGDARLRDDGNYFGAAINRCARLRAIAHGGQVLLSRTTYDLVADELPEGVGLIDRGQHRLRDLGRPEQVYTLVHPDLPTVEKPLRSLDSLPHNLPVESSSFVGRESELAQIAEALGERRALTLTGAGGCGKTRLALQAAAEAADRYPDGAWWVALAPLADPDLLDDALAAAVGVRPLPGQSASDAVVAHLASRRALVVLDNCEHLLDACARLTDTLLRDCPELAVLVTSREPLGLPGERSWRVPSLSLPEEEAPAAIATLARSDAVRLFVERAVQVRPNFAVTEESAPAVARICHDLDGIPLAIELAAARVRMLSVEQIAAGLGDRFRLLTGGPRTALPRQQTLRASVDWSHELLDEAERTLLRRLGVFAGGFTLDACEAVCAGDGLDRYAILDLLTALVDRSLVLAEERRAATRYRLLETVRHYALDRLLEAGETERLRDRHRDAFLALGERLEADLVSERQPETLQLLDTESANLYAALDWAVETDPELALRLCYALTFWWRLGRPTRGTATLGQALDAASSEPSVLRARALWTRAYLAGAAGEVALSEESANAALTMGEEMDDPGIQGRALHALAFPVLWRDPRGCVELARRARELARATGDDFVVADISQILGFAHWMQDDYETARREEALAFEIGSRFGYREIIAFHWLAESNTPWGSTDFVRRRNMLERALATSAEVNDAMSAGFGEAYIAIVDVQTGHSAAALERLERARRLVVVAGAGMALATIDHFTGVAQLALGRLDQAHATLADVAEREGDGFAHLLAWTHATLATVARLRGDPATAAEHAERCTTLAEFVGCATSVALARVELGRLAAARGDWAEAERLLQDALGVFFEHGQEIHLPDVLEALAEVAAGLESRDEAARLLSAAARAREDCGLVRCTPEAEHWRALADELRAALGDEDYEAAAGEGRGLSLDEAVAYVRRARGERRRPPAGWESLTPTEIEVVRHVGDGLTNPEIGERMFISRGTVKVHLSHVYAKLRIRNRSELAAEVARRGR